MANMIEQGKLLRTVVIREYAKQVEIECEEHTANPATMGTAHRTINEAAAMIRLNNLGILKSLKHNKKNGNQKNSRAQN